MHILVTGTQGLLGQALVKDLGTAYKVHTLNLQAGTGGSGPTDLVGDPRERDVAAAATSGCEAIIDLRALALGGSPTELDRLDAATRGTYNLITTASAAKRFILISSLCLFESYPIHYRVTEQWAPRPTTNIEDLVYHLSEVTVREVARVAPIKAIGLRLGTVVDDESLRGQTVDPRLLHVEDAIQAIRNALTLERPPIMHVHPSFPVPEVGWWVFHVPGGGEHTRFPLALAGEPPFDYAPRHDLVGGAPNTAEERQPSATETLRHRPGGASRRVVIYGAGGPVAAAATDVLARDHMLRLTDVRQLAEIVADAKPTKRGAPLPHLLQPPHEFRVADVTDPDQVLDAARDMDGIINCTVRRDDPVQAFRVNTLGAYNVVRAAVAAGIRRVVQTGPQQVTLTAPAGYWYDFGVAADVPGRPGTNLYILTKFLGHEICRIFAEEHDLEIPLLLFSEFQDPTVPPEEPFGAFPFTVSWNDAAIAMRQALHVPTLPHAFEVFHITADLPHGKYSNDKAKDLLKWQPLDRLEAHWTRVGWPHRRDDEP